MAEPISIQQLKDASEDAITLADFIYKPANVMIPRRLAADINSLQYYLDYMSSYAQHSYETYDEMVTNTSNLSENVSVFVTNDLDKTKNGIYTYNGTSFVKGEYQPENAAKDYVEAKLGGLEVFDGKVRAQDVSTADGSTQADKNTEFRNEIDALPFEGGVLADTFVTATATKQGTIARTQRERNMESLNILDFGGICDGTLHTAAEWIGVGKRFATFESLKTEYPSAVDTSDSIDSLAIEAAIKAVGFRGNVKLVGFPIFNKTVKFPANADGICIYADNIIYVTFVADVDGFDLSLRDENAGKNELKNMVIQGLDQLYSPAGYVYKSTGKGIKINRAYDNTFTNVSVSGFYYGFWLRQAFNNKTVGMCSAVGNAYGVYIDGDATNLNNFDEMKIRLNYICGVYIGNAGSTVYATKNSFKNCYIETNVPFLGDYVSPPSDGSHSVGVRIKQGYGNDFSGTYFENQDFDIWLEDGASFNIFDHIRQAPDGDNFLRPARIMFKGAGVNNNSFVGAEFVSYDNAPSTLVSDHAEQLYNDFSNTVGYTFKQENILCYDQLIVTNTKKHLLVYGDMYGAITRAPQGFQAIAPPQITGNGTTSAVINAKGFGELMLGTTITAPTTITGITGLRVGQVFILSNYQIDHPVTIKASPNGYSGLALHNGMDAVLEDYSDSITFYVIGTTRIVEIGRSVRKPTIIRAASTLGNPIAGTGAGQISGIGTTTATLNATGYDHIYLGSQINAATTITAITGLKAGQFFTLSINGILAPVTIKSSAVTYKDIILNGGTDIVLTKQMDSVTFIANGATLVMEVGRCIAPVV